MNNLNAVMQNLFNTVTKSGTVNDSYVKRITRFDALFTSIESIDDGFILTDVNDRSFNVTKYQLLGLVIENPAKLDSIAVRKGGVDNTMLSYSASDTKQAIVETSPASLLIDLLKDYYLTEQASLKAKLAKADIDGLLTVIANTGQLIVDDTSLDVSSIISLVNAAKYAEQLNKFVGCFATIKTDSEALETGNSKQLQVTLFDSEIVENKIVALYKATDLDSKTLINARLAALGFTGIKWTGNTSLTVNL